MPSLDSGGSRTYPTACLQRSNFPAVLFRFPAAEPQTSSECVDHCLGVLRSCCPTGSYYWGITENPMRRWVEGHCQTYDTMRVVVVCRTSRETGLIERQLISQSRAGYRCNNVGAGGERASAGSPHFVYLCSREDGLIRGRPGGGGKRMRMGTVADDLAFFRL